MFRYENFATVEEIEPKEEAVLEETKEPEEETVDVEVTTEEEEKQDIKAFMKNIDELRKNKTFSLILTVAKFVLIFIAFEVAWGLFPNRPLFRLLFAGVVSSSPIIFECNLFVKVFRRIINKWFKLVIYTF